MAATIARLVGGAGTGKTTELLRLMELVIDRGIDPHNIGFVSFTRAARAEASTRAAERFGVTRKSLETNGWFRTLHSVCYRALGVSSAQMVTDDRESAEWIADVLQEPPSGKPPTGDDDALGYVAPVESSRCGVALTLWAAARNRLCPVVDVWRDAVRCNDTTPGLDYCRSIIDRYEQRKLLDNRIDFVDLLCMFAGVRCRVDGCETTRPLGDVPHVPVWFFDEQQDASALLDRVCHRLISHDACRWVYVVGDPFQAIYGWAGADSRLFRKWDAATERIMPKSYRCPDAVLRMGEDCIRDCSDYFDRKILPADHGGTVDSVWGTGGMVSHLNPASERTVGIAVRTNYQLGIVARHLDENNIPWKPTRGHGGWSAPARSETIAAFVALQHGKPISWDAWGRCVNAMPARDMFRRGAKAENKRKASAMSEHHPDVKLWAEGLGHVGVTPAGLETIQSGRWTAWVPKSDMWLAAAQRWGVDAVTRPRVNVGTVHSMKGAEFDDVYLNTAVSRPVVRSQSTPDGWDEERRVEYVGVTRARHRLVLVHQRGATAAMRLGVA